MKKPYEPSDMTQRVFEHIRSGKLSNSEIAWIEFAIDKRREHYAKQLLSGFEMNEPKAIRWARKQIKELDWLCNNLIALRREMMMKAPQPRRNSILRVMPVRPLQETLTKAEKRVDAKPEHKKSPQYRQQAQKANFDKLYGPKKSRRAVKQVNFAVKPIRDHYRD